MADITDLNTAAALIAANDLAQVTTQKAALDSLVTSTDSLLAAMPDMGMPSAAKQFIQKCRGQFAAYSQEADYLINQLTPKS